MPSFNFKAYVWASVALLTIGSTADAATLFVNCGGSHGLTSINAAIKVLKFTDGGGANTISVTGACHENVLIQNINQLTIAGSNGASITDVSSDTADVFDIRNSRVTITGMTIDGKANVNWDAVDCEQGSNCTLVGNTIQGGADAVGVYANSSAVIFGGVLQNATSAGIWARGDVVASGVLIQGNPLGIGVVKGGRATATIADPAWSPIRTVTQTAIVNNGAGVQVIEGAQFQCTGCSIRDNGGDGIHADMSAAVTVQRAFPTDNSVIPPSITRNAGYGVYLGDLTSVAFHGPDLSVSQNAQPDIACNSALAASRGALGAAGGTAHTNCAN